MKPLTTIPAAGPETTATTGARGPFVFIINPVSGKRGRHPGRLRRLEAFLKRRHLEAEWRVTEGPGHATQLAREAVAAGAGTVVSIGGDGTMNEVAAGLVGGPACYGMIPTGSGNGLGRHLGLPMAFDRALETLLVCRERTIDTGEVNGRPFFNVMGMGFDAEIGRRFNASARRGFLPYVTTTLRCYFTYQPACYRVESPAGGFEGEAFLLAVANSSQYGNNAHIAPRARLDDGALDLVAVTSGRLRDAPVLGVRLFGRTIDRSPKVTTLAGPTFAVKVSRPVEMHTDGEYHGLSDTFAIRVRPASLRVLAP
ncbi:MAG: diacylglycerol kinase family lipid kinase [Puniceicoccaceae bacterium]|nr:MAG: diacylglycerol kinase family lipid kinase [Puniceicoccaceae bacterium]